MSPLPAPARLRGFRRRWRLLDRGYGKSGTALAADGETQALTLYQRIELVDGTADNPEGKDRATDNQD